MMTSRLVDLNPQMCITADKGFNYSAQDEAFIVQKKNHFQVVLIFGLNRNMYYEHSILDQGGC